MGFNAQPQDQSTLTHTVPSTIEPLTRDTFPMKVSADKNLSIVKSLDFLPTNVIFISHRCTFIIIYSALHIPPQRNYQWINPCSKHMNNSIFNPQQECVSVEGPPPTRR